MGFGKCLPVASILGLIVAVSSTNEVSADDGALKFMLIGDWGESLLPGQEYVAAAMGDWASTNRPSFVLTAGDNFYPWGVYSPDDWRFDFSWREIYTHPAIADLPWYITLGNHDYGDVDNEWNQVHFSALEPRWILPHPWHDFKKPIGDKEAHFIVFDTEAWRNNKNRTEQEEWFEATLASSDAHWKIVVGHRPVFSTGRYGPATMSLYQYLTPLFSQYGVDLYLAGHDHNLQYIRAVDGQGPDYVVNGAGGSLWYTYEEEAEMRLREEFGMELSYFEMDWGFVGFTITEESITAEYLNSDGDSLYNFVRLK